MLFKELAKSFKLIEETASRLQMTALLSEVFGKSTPEEAEKIAYLIQGKILPDYMGVELGIGERFIIQGISNATGYSSKDIEELYKKVGDLGEVAERLIASRRQVSLFQKELTVLDVYSTLYKIAMLKGEGSQSLKIKYVTELLNNSSPLEAKYIVRILLNKLRLGVGDPTILDALSWSKTGTKELRPYIERAYNLCSDLGYVAKKFIEEPKSIRDFKIELFRPIRPALAERLRSGDEIFKKIGRCAVEYKYDGFRQQVHKKGKEVRIFSRRLERMDYMFPDLIETIKELPYDEIIFEGEALAYNAKKDRFFSFQETMHRRRKYGIEEASKEYPLHLYVFDVMYVNGNDLTTAPYKERRSMLETIFPFKHNLKRSHMVIAENGSDITNVFNEAINKGLEGIVAKDLNAPYVAGKREFAWIKLKKSYGSSVDTIDAVIVGYYKGKGSRARFGFGGFLVAVYNEEEDVFETVAKVGSGFTEEEMEKFHSMLESIKMPSPPKQLRYSMEPDVWVEPKYVVEVAFDNITISSQHTCGITMLNGKGFALRFPRFIRLRDDKSPYEVTTTREVSEMYSMQGALA